MEPETNKDRETGYTSERNKDNSISVYKEDANGKREEVMRADVWSTEEVARFREIASQKPRPLSE